jgi:signal transduction histidine kinase
MSRSSERVIDQARQSLRQERRAIQASRTRLFLIAQTIILALAVGVVLSLILAGFFTGALLYQSVGFCAVTGALTAAGWWVFHRHSATTGLVLVLLYLDSVVGFIFVYASGEFENMGLAFPLLCVVMAPIFAGRKHVWGLAIFQACLFTALLLLRQYDLLQAVLPYGYMVDPESVKDASFVADSFAAYMIVNFGIAWLAGQVSLDILSSQKQLEDEVAAKTRQLAEATEALAARNAELAVTNQKLTASNEALGQFNAAVSHDLRSPLQTILSSLELMQMIEPELTSGQERLIVRSEAAANHMARLLAELLRLSRVTDRLDQLIAVPMEEVVSAARENLAARLESSGARLEIVLPLPEALGSRGLLVEVLQNLIENGVKYGDAARPCVRIEAAPAPRGRVAVAVEDNGHGVPEAERERVFSLFSRLESHKDVAGTGAGLAITQRIVQVHGGEVRIEDGQALSGARFVIELLSEEEQVDERLEDIVVGPSDLLN